MREAIRDIILQAVETQEQLLPVKLDRARGDDAPLFGEAGPLDSMALVTVIVDVEASIERQLGRSVILVSEKAMSAKRSPFSTVGTLTSFIDELLMEEIGA